jgi:hypothetical protein
VKEFVMRKLATRIWSSIKKAVVTTGSWFKSGFLAAYRALRTATRFVINSIIMIAGWTASVIILALFVAANAVLWVVGVISTLIQKALALATIIVMLPFLAVFGARIVKNALRAIGQIFTVWSFVSVKQASGYAVDRVIYGDQPRETVDIIVETGAVPAAARKGRPTPKQRQHRPARLYPQTA